jgi:hypothetical protein
VNALVRTMLRKGFRQGLLGGSRFWLVVGGVAGAIRLIQRSNERENQIVFSEELKPGESFVIAHGLEPR